MTLMRWDPYRGMLHLKKEMDRLFTDYEDESGTTRISTWRPSVDIYEEGDNLVLKAELPGVDKKDVKINLENDVLTISGEKQFDNKVEKENYHRVERAYGSFCRSFTLPNRVDKEKIAAKYNNGVLEVTLPTKEEAKPKQIEISIK